MDDLALVLRAELAGQVAGGAPEQPRQLARGVVDQPPRDDPAVRGAHVDGVAGGEGAAHLDDAGGEQRGPPFGDGGDRTGIQVQPPSENGLVQLAVVGLSDDVTGYDQPSFDAVKALRADLEKAVTGDIRYGVTGTVAQGYDQQESGNRALLIVGLATALLILVLLALIFRSVLICLLPLLTVGFILTPVSTGLIATWL